MYTMLMELCRVSLGIFNSAVTFLSSSLKNRYQLIILNSYEPGVAPTTALNRSKSLSSSSSVIVILYRMTDTLSESYRNHAIESFKTTIITRDHSSVVISRVHGYAASAFLCINIDCCSLLRNSELFN